jgi:hypothetical protein
VAAFNCFHLSCYVSNFWHVPDVVSKVEDPSIGVFAVLRSLEDYGMGNNTRSPNGQVFMEQDSGKEIEVLLVKFSQRAELA